MRSVKIGDKDTATDWDLILNNIDIEFPQPKTEYINIPLGDGSIDMTEALTGVVNYQNRKGKLSFTLIIGHSEREARLAEIASYLHGRKHKVVLPDDPDHYLMARLSIGGLKREGQVNTFVLNVVADPYRYLNAETKVSGQLSGSPAKLVMTIDHTGRPVLPTLTNDKEVTLTVGTISQVISAGTSKQTALLIKQGKNVFTFTGVAGTKIDITYQEEVL